MISLGIAVKKAQEYLNNKELRIAVCTILKDGYAFAYEGKLVEDGIVNWYPIVTNELIFVDKNGTVKSLIGVERFDELVKGEKIKINS